MNLSESADIESKTYGKIVPLGGMTERLKVTVLKTVVVKATVGSNPTPSAGHLKKTKYWGGARVADWARLLSECRGFKPRPRVQIPPSPLKKTPVFVGVFLFRGGPYFTKKLVKVTFQQC